MRAVLATLLAGLFLWAQAWPSLASAGLQPAHECGCCPGPKCTCCLDPSESDSVPLQAAAFHPTGGRLALPDLLTAATTTAELPLIQNPAPHGVRAADVFLQVPAYRRHCALLL